MELTNYEIQCCYDIDRTVSKLGLKIVDTLVGISNTSKDFNKIYKDNLLIINYLIGSTRLCYVFNPIEEIYSVTIYSSQGSSLIRKALMSLEDLNSYMIDRRYNAKVLYLDSVLECDEYYYNQLYKEELSNLLNIVNKTCLQYSYNYYKLIQELKIKQKIKDSI